MFLTPEEQEANNQMLICCSRSQTARLVLDI
jgi:vanillate O-demethylase ferredoxin subunit